MRWTQVVWGGYPPAGLRSLISGLAGVTVHSHIPGHHFAGNAVIGNNIGTNNVAGDYGDGRTTGVYVGSVDPLKPRFATA